MRQNIVMPPALRPGATLGVVATSNPITGGGDAFIERGYERLRERGFVLREAPNCRTVFGHSAGTVAERVKALHGFFEDDGIDGIIAFWGGLNSNQLLEHLDYDLIAAHPKPFVGYSDVTCLSNVITARTGLITFSGPGVVTFAKPTLYEYSWRSFEALLMHGGSSHLYRPSEVCSDNTWYQHPERRMLERPAPGWSSYRGGTCRGRIVGGNLGTLLLLSGTPYWPDLEGCVLFVEEDEEESAGTIDRMFMHARHVGVFEQIAGLVVGRFAAEVGWKERDTLAMVLDRSVGDFAFPVMVDVDFGHTDPLMTFPVGGMCALDVGALRLELVEPWLDTSEKKL